MTPAARNPRNESFEMTILEGAAASAAFDERWDDLVLAQPVPNPTLLSTWLKALAVDSPAQPLTILVQRNGRLVAGGAFALHERLRPLGWKVATWLGSSLQLFSPDLIADPAVPAGPVLIADALLARVPAVYLVETPVLGLAAQAFTTRAPWARAFPEQPGYRVALPSPRVSRLERKSTYSIRRVERLGIEVNVRLAEAPHEVLSALDRFFAVHESRFPPGANGDRRFANEPTRQWYRDTIGRLARESRAFLIEIQESGYLMASQLTLLAGHGALFHGAATRPGGRLRGPGHVLMHLSLQHALDKGARRHGSRTVCGSAGRAERPCRAIRNPLRPSRDRALGSRAARAQPCRRDAESRPHASLVTARPLRRMSRAHPAVCPGRCPYVVHRFFPTRTKCTCSATRGLPYRSATTSRPTASYIALNWHSA